MRNSAIFENTANMTDAKSHVFGRVLGQRHFPSNPASEASRKKKMQKISHKARTRGPFFSQGGTPWTRLNKDVADDVSWQTPKDYQKLLDASNRAQTLKAKP